MEYVSCNFCKKDNSESIFSIKIFLSGKEESFNLVRCRDCGVVYMNPRPEKEGITRYYPQEKYYSFSQLEKKQQKKLNVVERLRDWLSQRIIEHYYQTDISGLSKLRRIANKFIAFLAKNRLVAFAVGPDNIKKGRILDIGCGDGVFLHSVKKIGWQAFGVEINEAAAEGGKARGLNIVNKDLLETGFPSDFFDVVRMWSVLEHLYKPYESLQEIYRVLKPGGSLIVQLPNFDSLAAKIFKERWSALTGDFHLYHFNAKVLEEILEKSGFEVLKIYTSSVGTFGSSFNIGNSYYIVAPILICIDFFLDKLGLGDCLVVFARKKF